MVVVLINCRLVFVALARWFKVLGINNGQERLKCESIVWWALVGPYLGCMVRFISHVYCIVTNPPIAILLDARWL